MKEEVIETNKFAGYSILTGTTCKGMRNSKMFIETKMSSIIKSISWCILATLITMSLVYIFFHRINLAAAVGGLGVAIKMLIYFIHERVWNKNEYYEWKG